MGKAMDVDPDIIDLVQGYTGDDNLEISEILMKSGELDVLVVDSVSALLPRQMAEGDISGDYIGLLARLMSKACLKLTPIANRTNTLLIFINQIRHSIGKWGDDRITSGGEALGFYTTTRTRVQGGETASSRIVDDKGMVIGHESDFLIIKNKLSAPWRKAKINLIYGQGYDFVEEVVNIGIDLGIIDQSGAWYYYPAGQKIDKWNGRASISGVFRSDEYMYEELRKSVKDMMGLNE
jgi:recombination protein RecA